MLTTSQRTVHGSYKPMYGHGPKRPPPLSLRSDANRSTASLPSRTPPSHSNPPAAPGRIRTPNSALAGTPRPYDRHRAGSTDQSVRSASLTSIVEMYQRPMTACSNGNGTTLRPAASFYYDYSEEFEQPAALSIPALESEIPICPIPQRAGGSSRPMVLREDSDHQLEPHDHVVTPDAFGELSGAGQGNFTLFIGSSHLILRGASTLC